MERYLCLKMKLCFLIAFIFHVTDARNLPEFVEQCYRNDKFLSECIIRNINQLKPRLSKGIPELQIPQLDPLLVSSAILANENTFKCNLTNIRLYHVNNVVLKNLNMSFIEQKYEMEFNFPSIEILANYHLEGKFVILQLNSSGECKGNITGMKIKNNLNFNKVTKNGKDYFVIKSNYVKASLDDANVDFDDLFGNNKELNKRANKVLNENIGLFLTEFIPIIENIINGFITQVVKNLYKKYSLDVLYPEKIN